MRIACIIKDTGGSPSGKAYYDDIILTTDTFNVPETDFDDDGHVTLADFGGISGKWQEVSAKYDMTGDGLINIDDFILFAIEWLEDTTTKNGYDLVW